MQGNNNYNYLAIAESLPGQLVLYTIENEQIKLMDLNKKFRILTFVESEKINRVDNRITVLFIWVRQKDKRFIN